VEAPWLDGSLVELIREISRSLGPANVTVNLVIVDDHYIREINREFRKTDRPTDVISFSYINDEGPRTGDDLVGEVYISRETIEKEAKELGVRSRSLFLRAGVHGLLHVIGHDHEAERDATRMEDAEKSILEHYVDADELDKLF
jgi:probable rRNA maturation factor